MIHHAKFLSTLSLRRATFQAADMSASRKDFYPRSPCGERLHYDNYNLHCVEISIHALLAESDVRLGCKSFRNCIFLSTLSLRRATNELLEQSSSYSISIHALLAESDIINNVINRINKIFLSTLSLRRAT